MTDIISTNGDFEAGAIAYAAAVADGLKGLFFLNTSVERAARNLADPSSVCSIVGSPSVQAGFLRMQGYTNFLQTDIPEEESGTIIGVVKTTDTLADNAHRPMYVSNFNSASDDPTFSTTYGVSLYGASSGANTQSATRVSAGNPAITTSAAVDVNGQTNSAWAMLCGRFRPDRTQIDNLTTDETDGTDYVTARVLSKGTFRIGSSYSGGFTGLADIAAVAIYDRFLSDAERDAQCAQIAAYLYRRWSIAV